MTRHLSIETRATLMQAIAKQPMSASEIAGLIGESAARTSRWLERRSADPGDVYIEDWRPIVGTNTGVALWRSGLGVSAPFPRSKFQRDHSKRIAAIRRATELARRRAASSARPKRDSLVAAFFGPYQRNSRQQQPTL